PGTLIEQDNTHTGIQKRQFTQPFGQNVVGKLDVGEGFRRRVEMDFSSGGIGVADFFQGGLGYTVLVNLLPHMAFAADRQFQAGRKGVHYRHPYTVQSAGYLVGIVIEFSAGVQHRHDDFRSGPAFFRMNVDRNATAIVGNPDRFISVNDDPNFGTVAGQRFIDGVVDHLEHHMVQTCAIVGIADIHAGALAYGVQAFEYFDAGRVIAIGIRHGVVSLSAVDGVSG